MDATARSVVNALKRAILREDRTAHVYEEKAKRMVDEAAKAVLLSLSKQELGHARKIKRVLESGGDFSKLGKKGKPPAGGLHVINRDIREMEKESETVKVLRRAIKAETNSSRFYRSLENIYKGLEVGELFGKLAEEEQRHQARLEKVLSRAK